MRKKRRKEKQINQNKENSQIINTMQLKDSAEFCKGDNCRREMQGTGRCSPLPIYGIMWSRMCQQKGTRKENGKESQNEREKEGKS